MLPKPLWHAWYCHVLIAVTFFVRDSSTVDWQTSKGSKLFCLTHFQNLQMHMFHHSWQNCAGFWQLKEMMINFPFCAMMLSQKCPAILVFLVLSFLPLCPIPFTAFHCYDLHLSDSKMKETSKGSMLFPILALSLGINFPFLYAMLKHNPSSKLK